jgi:hypothetical protein
MASLPVVWAGVFDEDGDLRDMPYALLNLSGRLIETAATEIKTKPGIYFYELILTKLKLVKKTPSLLQQPSWSTCTFTFTTMATYDKQYFILLQELAQMYVVAILAKFGVIELSCITIDAVLRPCSPGMQNVIRHMLGMIAFIWQNYCAPQTLYIEQADLHAILIISAELKQRVVTSKVNRVTVCNAVDLFALEQNRNVKDRPRNILARAIGPLLWLTDNTIEFVGLRTPAEPTDSAFMKPVLDCILAMADNHGPWRRIVVRNLQLKQELVAEISEKVVKASIGSLYFENCFNEWGHEVSVDLVGYQPDWPTPSPPGRLDLLDKNDLSTQIDLPEDTATMDESDDEKMNTSEDEMAAAGLSQDSNYRSSANSAKPFVYQLDSSSEEEDDDVIIVSTPPANRQVRAADGTLIKIEPEEPDTKRRKVTMPGQNDVVYVI